MLQQLTAMNPNPTIGLAEAAEMLCKHLGVALVRWVRWFLLHGCVCCTNVRRGKFKSASNAWRGWCGATAACVQLICVPEQGSVLKV